MCVRMCVCVCICVCERERASVLVCPYATLFPLVGCKKAVALGRISDERLTIALDGLRLLCFKPSESHNLRSQGVPLGMCFHHFRRSCAYTLRSEAAVVYQYVLLGLKALLLRTFSSTKRNTFQPCDTEAGVA